MSRIILASNSASRKQAMESLGLKFEVIPSNIDEKQIRDLDPLKLAEKLAVAKAQKVAETEQGVIISADTFCTINQEILEKPNTFNQAREMLRSLTKEKAKAITGFSYLDAEQGIKYSSVVTTEFRFRKLTESEIEAYVNNFPVLSWSAAFSPAHHEGMLLLAEVWGDISSFVFGLPVTQLIECLEKSKRK